MPPETPHCEMTSMERVMTTIGLHEPDRVPLFLPLTVQGAAEMGVPLQEYFRSPRLMAESQLRFRQRYGNDFLCGPSYSAVEFEAFGGEVRFYDRGPPNAGEPIVRSPDDIAGLGVPRIEECPALCRLLEAQSLLSAAAKGAVPVVGVVVSPFSLPVMQMGFPAYLQMLMDAPEALEPLWSINETFCVAWANAQLAAGATALVYSDPVSSSTILTPELYRRLGQPIARRTLARIAGPTVTHFASGRALSILPDVLATGTQGVAISADDDLAAVKAAVGRRASIFGNLNGLAMLHWNEAEAERQVKNAIAAAGVGGGFVLTDHHGEIPFDVPDAVLLAVAESVRRWGQYPLTWVDAWRASR
ncbi:methylcobamide--CoM methyltransferase MtbA [Candidatus Methylospira mobilis]|uniref:Methylcobamide--CoM methyltransferase MtbA n=1 Tax=Candidatus Methylospira mobilis TaxID=1808979 RepID=A0A5Q0BJ67_9GAMM|nr:uroporphyrinogen decarboxylase family protein [Candidatus Methylospira mobilis]QFY43853.1 methylcobamide--CoM methyltransferase MtbA [Candidatus Methylospira mobilis]